MIDRSDPTWYKDAVIYQTHVKAFFDSNNDGIGDFAGVTAKLDYIHDLGVNTIWVLPFFPSPLRDDGYDIADYRNVNPAYGTMRDFRRFVQEAHRRGIRVIIELVVNHTSDQHPWFQRARRAKPGSVYRDYYVWSDTDQKYQGTRIIFIDTESSNWSWDPVAKAYYWHRFYSHQPDLNYDNPRVLREVISVLHFWLDTGVDGLRLDAVPYLIEREGTNNENLAETHEVLKKIRAEIDAHYPNRMMLAEANQWPEDVQEYFGNGDECHMCFHFPLMPRMYMAIAQEDRHPITDIMRQTPEIPPNCQWAVFLRNHDELTLEMVTNRERDYLWETYARDKRMRINLGIRRRLAPLMERDRRKIELMNGLLFSMPGTPIIYYGDELGMGDNIFLGDRDGVRTPMQWSPDRNAGFSRADPARLYLPPIMDPVYGYGAVNVEAAQADTTSLLNWMKRMLAVRQAHKEVFGRGRLTFLYPNNRKILAYLREHEDEWVLCVVNLSRSAQAVELNLAPFRTRVPVELLGRQPFPPIGDLPYLLTLPGYGFYWFALAEEAALPRWHQPIPEPMPEFATLVVRGGLENVAAAEANRRLLETEILPQYLVKQRWFGAKDATITGTRLGGWAVMGDGQREGFLLLRSEVDLTREDSPHSYFMPLAVSWDDSAVAHGSPLLPYTLAQIRRGARVGALYDAMVDERVPMALIEAMGRGDEVRASDGTIRFSATSRFAADLDLQPGIEVRRVGVEQSNSSVLIGEQGMLKAYRRVIRGQHPELEVGRFLTEQAHYENTPPLLGAIEHIAEDGTPTALAILMGFVRNQGDGWAYTLNYLDRVLEEISLVGAAPAEGTAEPVTEEERHGSYLAEARTLGQRTAELHRALAIETDDSAFRPEPVTAADLRAWRGSARGQGEGAFAALRQALPRLAEEDRAAAEALLARRDECFRRIDALVDGPVRAAKTRFHGDYHLGQVLVVKKDFYIVDFEGEPRRPLEERRAKGSPLKDVAGMLRSFDYAAHAAVIDMAENRPDAYSALAEYARRWREATVAAFMDAYVETVAGCPSYPDDPAEATRLIDLFLLEKALYEIGYEAANRPGWLRIPIEGVTSILDRATAEEVTRGAA